MFCENSGNDKFKRLMKVQHQLIQSKLDKYNLYRGQHIILFIISDNKGITQKDISSILKVKPSTVSVSIKRLEKSGYLEKRIDPEDSRKTDMYLTATGNEIVSEIKKEIDSVHETLYKGLTESEKEVINNLFDKMITNIEGELNDEVYKTDV
jgi:DNA-binding MarR family transcriptional regulator